MISYITEVSLYWLVGYMLYLAVFDRWTLFEWNRRYLLIVLVGSTLIPFIPLPVSLPEWSQSQYLPELLVTLSGEINTIDQSIHSSSGPSLWTSLRWIYFAGLLFFIARTFISLWAIRGLLHQGFKRESEEYTLVQTMEEHPPFAFGHWIFISRQFDLSNKIHRIILNHERAHVRARHTLDVLLTELMGWFFWFHPMIYLYRHALRLNHEYSADADVLNNYSKVSYGRALLAFHRYQPEWHLTRSFHFSKLKKRFIKMDKQKTNQSKRWIYLLTIPLFLIACSLFNINDLQARWINPASNMPTQTQDTLDPGDKVYKVAEVMPLFPGCKEVEDRDERRSCSNKKMIQYIYGEVNYPKEALEQKTEGTAIVHFVIGSDGYVKDVELVRDPGHGLGDAAVRAVEAMQRDEIRWSPGRQDGERVAVQYTLPIRFALPEDQGNSPEEEKALIRNISPNPSNQTIRVELSGKDEPADLVIKDAKGAIIRRQKIRTLSPREVLQFSIDEKGTYWLQVSQKEESNVRKFVIN